MDAPEPKIIESGESLDVSIRPGERCCMRNETGAARVVIVTTRCGTEVQADWPEGATLQIKGGSENVTVVLADPVVDSPAPRAQMH